MTPELKADDADARGVRSILCQHLEEAIQALSGKRVSDRDVHSARKSVKKARATLRLMRDAIPEAIYKRENVALRNASRPLSAVRDARVLLDTLDRLEKLYEPAARHSSSAAFRRDLVGERNRVRAGGVQAPRNALRATRGRIASLSIDSRGWDDIGSGFERSYRKGRRAMQQARATPSPERLHEWRKQTKYLWHQLQTLEPLCPGPIGELADQAQKLSEYLGDDHDLAVLREKVASHSKAFPDPGGADALLALVDRSQTRLREKAFVSGQRVFDARPKRFAAQLQRYWETFRA